MDESLKSLTASGAVDPACAFEKALDKEEFSKWMNESEKAPPLAGS